MPGQMTWKLCGPDLNGRYGGMNGAGGLEATATGAGYFSPTISDARGNILGACDPEHGTVTWNPSRPTGYGAVPGYRPLPLGHGGSYVQSAAWRGKWVDVTGYIYIGKRFYDPIAGMWLSADPVWNSQDPSYWSYAGGDPINHFDPDGRCVEATGNFIYNGGAAGYGLRQLGGYLDSYNNSSAGGGYFTALSGTVINELAGASAPSSYVNGLQGFGNSVSTIYNDSGFVPAASYAISGWNVGKIYSGFANQDLVTGEPVGDWYARGTQIASGTASTAGITAGGLWGATKLGIVPPAAPLVAPPSEVPPVITAPADAVGITALNDNDVVVGLVRNGQIIAQFQYGEDFSLAMSHEQLAAQAGVLAARGVLSEGVEAFTVAKQGGQILVRGSNNFVPTVTQATETLLKQRFQ